MYNMRPKKKKILKEIACDWENCGRVFPNALELDIHIEDHLQNIEKADFTRELSCKWTDCDFKTECDRELARHTYYHGYYAGLLLEGVHENEKNPNLPLCYVTPKDSSQVPEMKIDFYCEWGDCKSTFLSIVKFQDHIERHVVFYYEIEKSPGNQHPQLQCNWNSCNKLCTSRYRLIEHVCKHSNKKKMACQQCGELFRTKTTFADHLKRRIESETLDYQCAQCLKLFPNEKLLRNHVVKHINRFKCSLCDMTRSSASALAAHIRYVHLKEKPFKCSLCDHRSVREYDLARHVAYVHEKVTHQCDQPGCSYTVQSINLLRRHILEVHNNNPQIYVCHCCEKAFKNGKSLSAHLMKVHNFQRPSGHKRFAYRLDENGFHRLETMRIESIEVSQQVDDCANGTESNMPDNNEINKIQSSLSDTNQNTIDCFHISTITNVDPDGKNVSITAEVKISLPNN